MISLPSKNILISSYLKICSEIFPIIRLPYSDLEKNFPVFYNIPQSEKYFSYIVEKGHFRNNVVATVSALYIQNNNTKKGWPTGTMATTTATNRVGNI